MLVNKLLDDPSGSTHTSFKEEYSDAAQLPVHVRPANTIMRFVDELTTAVWELRALGGVPVGLSLVQFGVPPRPLAFSDTQTSFAWPELVSPSTTTK